MTTNTGRRLDQHAESKRIRSWPTFTTRDPRGDDRPGDYTSVSHAEFERLWDEGKLYERDPTQNDQHYGKEKERLDWALETPGILICHLNYVGFLKVARDYPDNVRGVWLNISQETCARRYQLRCESQGDVFSQEKLDARLAKGQVEDSWLATVPSLVQEGVLRPEHLTIADGEPDRDMVYHQTGEIFYRTIEEFGFSSELPFGQRTAWEMVGRRNG